MCAPHQGTETDHLVAWRRDGSTRVVAEPGMILLRRVLRNASSDVCRRNQPTADGSPMQQLLIPWRATRPAAVAILLTTALLAACSSAGRPGSGAAESASPARPAASTATSATPTTTAEAAPPTPAPAAPPATPSCDDQQHWTTEPQVTATPPLIAELYLTRVGRHDCYDRIVFDVNGIVEGPDVVGYGVSYVTGEVTSDPRGEPVPTRGDAALQIVVRAPSEAVEGHQPWRPRPEVGDDLVPMDQLNGWDTFRQVTLAGSFEGQTTIAVGLSAQLPFRVGVVEQGAITHVYVDVAHEPLGQQ
jgi:hypothetical protein